MAEKIYQDVGTVTAYAYAVANGYTGTEEEFERDLGIMAKTLQDLSNLKAEAETLEPGEDASADYSDGVLTIGVPKGEKGDTYNLTPEDKQEIALEVFEMYEVTVTGTVAEIAGLKNHRYICGELASLDVTSLPTSGLVDILFTSGSTATVVTLPATVQMPAWFEVGANMTVEISILDGVWGSVQVWES